MLLNAAAAIRGVAEIALAQRGAIRARFTSGRRVAILRPLAASDRVFRAADTDARFILTAVLLLRAERGHRADPAIPALPVDAGLASQAAHVDAERLARRTNTQARLRVLDLARRTVEVRTGARAAALAGVGIEALAGWAVDIRATALAGDRVLSLPGRTILRWARARTGRRRSRRRRRACFWHGCRCGTRLDEVPVRRGFASYDCREASYRPARERLEHLRPGSARSGERLTHRIEPVLVHTGAPRWPVSLLWQQRQRARREAIRWRQGTTEWLSAYAVFTICQLSVHTFLSL